MPKFISKKMIVIVIAAIVIFLGFNAYLYIDYLNSKKDMKELATPEITDKQPSRNERNKLDPSDDNHDEIVNTEKKEPLIQQTQNRGDNSKSADDEVINSDNLSDAEKQLQHIKDNPQEWGTISQRGTELINLVFPIPEYNSEGSEGEIVDINPDLLHIEDIIDLLNELAELRDPRSAEVFVNYFFYDHWGRQQENALIDIGVPAIPHLVVCFSENAGLGEKLFGTRLIGIITSQHKKELGNIVDEIIIPGLDNMVKSDGSATVRHNAREALSLIQK